MPLSLLLAVLISLDQPLPAAPPVQPAPFGACPSKAQLEWHALEFYGFIHFTINTFTDREWGNGDESPTLFAPTDLDATQWAKVARQAGMKGLILTAKHHDGFCLWPSPLTGHSVRASPFKGGSGDVVREFTDACKAQGLLRGVYLSPWDRNHAEYGRAPYLEYYRAQLSELAANYGPFFEVWFDGANGGTGFYGGANEKRTIDGATYYDWPATNKLVLSQNPAAIIFSDAGPGCRWVGNESGYSDEESWQTLNTAGMFPGKSHDHLARGDKGGSHWVGVEVDVSIRPGWFWHEAENDRVKTSAQLLDLWFKSVGRGANLLLNIPPDRRGQFHEKDVASVVGLGAILDATFRENLAVGGRVSAQPVRDGGVSFAGENVLDHDRSTFWATPDDCRTATLTVEFAQPKTLDVVRVEEVIALGQRVESFTVEYRSGDQWTPLCRGSTIGPRRVIRVDPVTTTGVRLRIEKSLAAPLISSFGVFKLPEAAIVPLPPLPSR